MREGAGDEKSRNQVEDKMKVYVVGHDGYEGVAIVGIFSEDRFEDAKELAEEQDLGIFSYDLNPDWKAEQEKMEAPEMRGIPRIVDGKGEWKSFSQGATLLFMDELDKVEPPRMLSEYIFGPPGVGKSDLLKRAGEEAGIPFIDWKVKLE